MAVKKISPELFGLWLPVVLLLGIIFYASSIPGHEITSFVSWQSLGYHFLAYCFLAFFLARALRRALPEKPAVKIVFFVIIFGMIYGIIDELHQGFTPGRSVSGFDVFIDSLGSIIGSLIYR